MSQEAYSPTPTAPLRDRSKLLYALVIVAFLTALALLDLLLALCSAAVAAGVVGADRLSPSMRNTRRADRRTHMHNVSIPAG